MSSKALFVIDVQEDYTGVGAKAPFPYEGSEEFILKVNRIIEQCVNNGIDVIYIKQEFESFILRLMSKVLSYGTALKGSEGTELDKRLKIVPGKCFSKQVPSAFTNKDLKEYLYKNDINDLYITGLDGQFCVKETIRSAIKSRFNVTVIEDAVLFRNNKKIDNVMHDFLNWGVNVINEEEFFNISLDTVKGSNEH